MGDIVSTLLTQYPYLGDRLISGAIDVGIGIVILIIGSVVAWVLGILTAWAVNKLEIDKRIKEYNLHKGLLGFTITGISKIFVEVLVFLAFAVSAARYFHLPGLVTFTHSAMLVTAELLKATIIIIVTLLIGEYVSNNIKKSKITMAKTWGIVVEVLIAIIGVTIALNSVKFLNAIVLNNVVTAVVQGLALGVGLAIGLAFGLGAKDAIADVLKKKKKTLEELF